MKNRKEIFLAVLFIFFFLTQSYSQEVISTAGGSGSANGARVSWTVGEPVTETAKGTGGALTQGFNQGDLLIITAIQELEGENQILKIFPNPADNIINVVSDISGTEKMNYAILDLKGRKLKEGVITLPESQLIVNDLKSGVYFLKLYSALKEQGIYRIIKK
jgi:hypothetical protein